jgi:hypothetical protein
MMTWRTLEGYSCSLQKVWSSADVGLAQASGIPSMAQSQANYSAQFYAINFIGKTRFTLLQNMFIAVDSRQLILTIKGLLAR